MSLIESWVQQKASGFISPLSNLPKYCNPGISRKFLENRHSNVMIRKVGQSTWHGF